MTTPTPTLATPTGRLLGTWPAGSHAWHAARATRLGGSDMAAVLGRSPWVSPYRLWQLKAGQATDGPATAPQERGHYLEPAVTAWWADHHPEYDVVDAGTYTHAERDYQLANPDRLLIQDAQVVGLLEVKSTANDDDWGRDGTDQVPLYYRTQILWYLDCLGLKTAHVAMIGPRLELREYRVDYDPTDAAILRQHAETFLDSLLFNEAPDIDTTDSTYRTVRELHPDIDNDTEVELTLGQVAEFTTARDAKARADAEWTRVRAEMAEAMGTAKRAVFLGQRIATRQARGNGTPFVTADRQCPPASDFATTEVPHERDRDPHRGRPG